MFDPELDPAFEAVFMSGGFGSPQTDCGCGRTHFAVECPHFDEGELEGLQEAAAKNPGGYVAHHNADSISSCTIMGRTYVRTCECAYAARLSTALWQHRSDIAKYLRARNKRVAAQVFDLANQLDELEAEQVIECPECHAAMLPQALEGLTDKTISDIRKGDRRPPLCSACVAVRLEPVF